MSRKIKFRAWDGKDMLNINHWILSMVCEHIPEKHVVMQFADNLDKNGKEIWEGDIMNFKTDKSSPSGGHYAGTCGFHPENARVVEWDDGRWMVGGFRLSTQLRMYEVIGNIYEDKNAVPPETS